MPLIKIVPTLRKEKLARRLGHQRSARMSYSSRQKIKRLHRRMEQVLSPSLYFKKVPVSRLEGAYTELEDGTRFRSAKLARTLRGCDEVICFAATIGEGVQKEIDLLMKQDHLSEAYILDTMGSMLAENLVEQFWQNMSSSYSLRNRGVSIRFSPGYCDWPLGEQEKLFRFIDTRIFPVTLKEHCLMSLRKSVSGVFGISDPKSAQSVSTYIPCEECHKAGCEEKRSRPA